MMDLGTWTDWVAALVLGAITFTAVLIAGLRGAQRFRDDPADRKRDTDTTD
jgi:hypothetical protein